MKEKSKLIINKYGDKFWELPNGDYHREDGPAAEHSNGYKAWYLNGKLHREDGPAVEYSSGSKEWYLNGKRHREDGPAIEWSAGGKSWYLNGEAYTEEEFNKKMKNKSKPKLIRKSSNGISY